MYALNISCGTLSVSSKLWPVFSRAFIKLAAVSGGRTPVCGLEHFLRPYTVRNPAPAPAKIGYKIMRVTSSKNIGTNPYYSTRVKHGVNAAFCMVGHNEAAKLQACFTEVLLWYNPTVLLRHNYFSGSSYCCRHLCCTTRPITALPK
jgi:hypothetical protein